MRNFKDKIRLNISGAVLDKNQLCMQMEKLASDNIIIQKSSKETYPIPMIEEDFEIIKQTYKLLNNHVKLKIPIHPAGEWILDNFYIIDESVKAISKELTLKKYTNFLGLANGEYAGFARVYVLASEMVAYTDGKVEYENLEYMLEAYQNKKTLNMDEIWNIGLFIQIVLIQKIRKLCESIYLSQMQKYKAEIILSKFFKEDNLKLPVFSKATIIKTTQMKNTFIEYMSYKLKKYGRKAYGYMNVLEEVVSRAGGEISEIIKKEHFEVAVKKVSMGNCIISLKNIGRINFTEIFEQINGVEEILKQDPVGQYEKMDMDTKIYYRNSIQELAKKTKISEIYIARRALALSIEASKQNEETKKAHIGYYLISDGKKELLKSLDVRKSIGLETKTKVNLYIYGIWGISIIILIGIIAESYRTLVENSNLEAMIFSILIAISIIIPIENIVCKVVQNILSKIVKPKQIPKLDFQNGIPKEYTTMVVIPTILKSKEKVKELAQKLEVYYIANKSENLYFTILGDCSSGQNEQEKFDEEVINEGLAEVERLNKKYPSTEFKKFNFIYRKRIWSESEGCFMGWERKRGLLNQFNNYCLGKIQNPFRINTLEDEFNILKKKNPIKYIITLDSDTELTLNSGLELVGAMAHILNKPLLNDTKDLVVSGHALMQPRVGIGLLESRESIFTQIFAGIGGTDSYTSSVSDTYEDNFGEGIFTGKGIYELKTFEDVLDSEIKENMVLSHDLLEGSYLRCGLISNVLLMDGFPSNYLSYRTRLARWIRGDYQITQWLNKYIVDKENKKKKNPLNKLSKYKIFSNIVRSKQESAVLALILLFFIIDTCVNKKLYILPVIAILSVIVSFVIDLINNIISKNDTIKTKEFTKTIDGVGASFLRAILDLGTIPDKSMLSIKSEVKALYRMKISKKHLLEWMTSEDAEKSTKQNLSAYYSTMKANIILGIIMLIFSITTNSLLVETIGLILCVLWFSMPAIMNYIGRKNKEINKIQELSKEDNEYILNVGRKTWQYFKDNINENNNFLPPDNYQEDRRQKVVQRTSSTNIGLGLLAVIASYDLKYETLEETTNLLYKMIETISNLQKWNGHLYNWYNTKTLEPLIPRYVSSVDSGNFVGYLYVTKQFLEEVKDKELQVDIQTMIKMIDDIIESTNFKVLYDEKTRLFSVGYNVEEDKLTDSYYDLLASEARQTSIVAIAKKDISEKHWYNLSRTLTTLNKYKGLVSWSGTAFEYLMPTINIPGYPGSILEESCKFMIMSQIEYAKKIGIPWGISEAAFNLKDLNNNYQYKAFGIPWLGLKRGLEEEVVIASYGSILAINEVPNEVIRNMKELERLGMYDRYGFFESIDFTPNRNSKRYSQVKTFMAHHQGLILLSINNLINNRIFQTRFMRNPEMMAIKILLEERMPQDMIITKEEKEKIEKIKYKDYEDYAQRKYTKINDKLNISNVIANDKYTIVMDQYGNGYSNYEDIQVNRFKQTDDIDEGIMFYIKNIRTKKIWTNTISKFDIRPEKYNFIFAPEMNKFIRNDENIETTTKIIVDTDEPVEIRNIILKNSGNSEETLEVTSMLEPIISNKFQDYSHKAFNNLFLRYEYIDEISTILVERKARTKNEKDIFMAVNLYSESNNFSKLEFEIDKEKFVGRNNLEYPRAVKNSTPLSTTIGYTTEPIIAMRRTVTIKPSDSAMLNLIISVGKSKEEVLKNIVKFMNSQNVSRTFELLRAKSEAENRYLGIKGIDLEIYQRLLTQLMFPPKSENKKGMSYVETFELWKFGISGDNPILLLKIKEIIDIDMLKEVLKAYEFFRVKNIKIDLVIINGEKESYENIVREAIMSAILNENLAYLLNVSGGIFIFNNLEKLDKNILEAKANVILNANYSSLKLQIEDIELKQEENTKEPSKEVILNRSNEEYERVENSEFKDLKYFNEYGGFSEDGKEYLIKVNKNIKTPTVWSNILANKEFGTLTTESMGGYTWHKNSRLNRLTAWSNNSIQDIPSEVIYLKDMTSGKKWSLGASPMPDENDYYITYGFGYSKYLHNSSKIKQEVKMFVPQNDNVKINLITFENQNPQKKKLKLIYYIKPVLGEDEIKTNTEISLKYKSNMVFAETSKDSKMFVSSSEKITSFTGSKNSFFKGKGLSNPECLDEVNLSYENSYSQEGIIAIKMEIEVEAYATKEISLILGTGTSIEEMQELSYKYSNINNCKSEYMNNKRYWNNLVNTLQVKTPVESVNIMLNGWLIYQSIVARLYGRTGFYQSGGAYGFRDQLQDTLALKYIDTNFERKQILKHARNQFSEGDVQHWWHEESSRGIRTRMSDDMLWLPFVTADYIEFSNDYSILSENLSYKVGKVLDVNENERYDKYLDSDFKESLYEHCIKAIEKGINLGEKGLPKIGTGDWNDGMSNVGAKGKGESVWLGFFLYNVLDKFMPICLFMSDTERAEKYKRIMIDLKKALNTTAWDGRWYRRAFSDDGEILGSLQNEECRIDNISQSWAVISNAGDNDKKYIAMESLENHLVDREIGIIKLLDPPFDKAKINPGYIKSYLPGTRENGGQYTHAATWTIIAETMLGLNDKAYENFRMINPIEHARTKEEASKYKVEPYVISADVYGKNNLAGRGGWTWYTGSSSWYYIAGIKYILGLNIENGYIMLKPHVPSTWNEYEIKYKISGNVYNIKVRNNTAKSTISEQVVQKFVCNGEEIKENRLKIIPNSGIYNIEVEI